MKTENSVVIAPSVLYNSTYGILHGTGFPPLQIMLGKLDQVNPISRANLN